MIELKHANELVPEGYTGVFWNIDSIGKVYFFAIDGMYLEGMYDDEFCYKKNKGWHFHGYWIDLAMSNAQPRLAELWKKYADHPILGREIAALMLSNGND